METNKTVAVFIDAENINANYAERILNEASGYGDVIVKRVFADWSKPNVKPWIQKSQNLSLKPEQQFCPVSGKNTSDIALTVSLMATIFEKQIDVFFLASSDSDFIRLVQELREREKFVVGFGTQNTVAQFKNSFSEFIYLDKEEHDDKKQSVTDKLPADKLKILREIIDDLIERYGKANYGNIKTEMKNKSADFIPKNYGCNTMKKFVEKYLAQIGNYDVVVEKDGSSCNLAHKN